MTANITGKLVDCQPKKIEFTFPAYADREKPITFEVGALEVNELSVDLPVMNFVNPFEMIDGKAINYPYLKIVCISERIEKLKDNLWLKSSLHTAML